MLATSLWPRKRFESTITSECAISPGTIFWRTSGIKVLVYSINLSLARNGARSTAFICVKLLYHTMRYLVSFISAWIFNWNILLFFFRLLEFWDCETDSGGRCILLQRLVSQIALHFWETQNGCNAPIKITSAIWYLKKLRHSIQWLRLELIMVPKRPKHACCIIIGLSAGTKGALES